MACHVRCLSHPGHGTGLISDPSEIPLCGRRLGSDCTVPDVPWSGSHISGGVMSSASLDGHRPRILAINNDPAVLALFRDLLEEEGYAVSTHAYLDHDLNEIKAL